MIRCRHPAGFTGSCELSPAAMTSIEKRPRLEADSVGQWLTPGRFALFLGLLILAMFPAVLLGERTFVIRDFGMFGYPLAYFHRESFWRGELPLWNPLSNCGLPFLAQWNTLVLYPFSLIYLLLPLTWSLPFFCLAHLFWGGLGMYLLACSWTRHRLAAALAGIVFAFNGLSLNALMWPNVEATLGWLPWVIWLGQKGWREGGKALVWAVLAGAMQMLAGGPEPIFFTWIILFALACGDWITRAAARGWILVRFSLLGALVALVCAVQLLPFLELLAHSQRDTGFAVASHDWSMPFWGWANFLVPLFRTSPTAQGVFFQNGQYWTSSYYAGVGTVLLAAVAVWRVRDWRVWVLAGLAFLGAVLALGDCTLLYGAVHACLPGIGFLRYPVKAVILVLALAPLLAAFGFAALDDIFHTREPGAPACCRLTTFKPLKPAACRRFGPAGNLRQAGRFECGVALLLLLLITAVVAWDWKSPIPADAWRATWQSGLSRAAFLVLVFLLGAGFLKSRGRWRTLLGFLFLVAFWLDLATHVPNQNPTARASIYASGFAKAELKWNPQPRLGVSRVLLAPAALEALRVNPLRSLQETYLRNRLASRANCNLLDAVPLIDGFFSLTPREVLNVTALLCDQPDRQFPALLDFLGVSQTSVPRTTSDWTPRPTAMPIVSAGQQPLFADDGAAFAALSQTNLDLRRIVYLPPGARRAISAGPQPAARVHVAHFANQSISLRTTSPTPCIVAIAQTYYPAWKAYVDGRSARLWRANYAFQAVEVPAGAHEVLVAYEDKALVAGAVLTGLGLLACAGLWLKGNASRGVLQLRVGNYKGARGVDALQNAAAPPFAPDGAKRLGLR